MKVRERKLSFFSLESCMVFIYPYVFIPLVLCVFLWKDVWLLFYYTFFFYRLIIFFCCIVVSKYVDKIDYLSYHTVYQPLKLSFSWCDFNFTPVKDSANFSPNFDFDLLLRIMGSRIIRYRENIFFLNCSMRHIVTHNLISLLYHL